MISIEYIHKLLDVYNQLCRPLCQQTGIPQTSLVVGHVGNFHTAKNHHFILKVAQELFLRNPNSRLVLVGDGRLRNRVKELAEFGGFADKVVFTGTRSDVPRLLAMMDVFLFPSLYEGLGLAAIEAQAAGLPIVIADSVPKETEVVSDLFVWMSLSQPPELWAEKCLQLGEIRKNEFLSDSCRKIEESSFNIMNNLQELDRIYTGKTA